MKVVNATVELKSEREGFWAWIDWFVEEGKFEEEAGGSMRAKLSISRPRVLSLVSGKYFGSFG
jgi:hypothetical protein